jgi:hypothetical protein
MLGFTKKISGGGVEHVPLKHIQYCTGLQFITKNALAFIAIFS